MDHSMLDLKLEDQDLEIEYSIVAPDSTGSGIEVNPTDSSIEIDSRAELIQSQLHSIDQAIVDNDARIEKLDNTIDQLTNKADWLDYTVAVSSGVFTGLIDAFFVGAIDFEHFRGHTHEQVNHFINNYAQMNGYRGDNLTGAISFLENKYPVPNDNVWKGEGFTGSRLHHLDDFAHHPTPMGLVASIFAQYLSVGLFSDRRGNFITLGMGENSRKAIPLIGGLVVSGVLNWLIYVAESKYKEQIDEKVPQPIQKIIKILAQFPALIPVLKAASLWFGHLVSDMGGSKNTAGGGMGIPGVFLSLMKEISALPGINQTGLPQLVSDLYSKGGLDMRAEATVLNIAGKQSVPVLINEAIVRTFYFVRHLISEYKEKQDWKNINWMHVFPWGNRTIARMMTISSGTFMATDMLDAAIRAGLNSKGNSAEFGRQFLMRVNFVGIGRFTIALGNDIAMGSLKRDAENERRRIYTTQLHLYNAKIFYKEGEMWLAAKDAQESIRQLEYTAAQSVEYYKEGWTEIKDDLVEISEMKEDIEEKNPGIFDDISNYLS